MRNHYLSLKQLNIGHLAGPDDDRAPTLRAKRAKRSFIALHVFGEFLIPEGEM